MKVNCTLRRVVSPLFVTAMLSACGGGGGKDEVISIASGSAQSSKVALLLAPPSLGVVEVAPPGASLVGMAKLTEVRLSRTVFRYTYQVSIANGANSLKNVRVHLTAVGDGSTIEDGLAVVGNVAPQSTVLVPDTISITHDRNKPFDPSALRWTITADALGALGALDRSSSVSGPDLNGNGIRDDIELVIAELPLDAATKTAATQVAKALQRAAVASITPEQAEAAQIALERAQNCVATKTTDYARVDNTVLVVTFNTEVRTEALGRYMSALKGRSLPDVPSGNTCE